MSSSCSLSLSEYLSVHPDFKSPSSSSSPLPSLYSDLSRQKRSNPSGYRVNLQWWNQILSDAVLNGAQRDSTSTSTANQKDSTSTSADGNDRLVLHVDENMRQDWTLQQVGRPLGLGTVIQDLSLSSHLISLPQFLSSSKPFRGPLNSSNPSWIPSPSAVASFIILKPLSWGFSQLGIGSSQESFSEDGEFNQDEKSWKRSKGDWIVWENLKVLGDQVLEKHFGKIKVDETENVFSRKSFKESLLGDLKFGGFNGKSKGKEKEIGGGNGGFKLSELDVKVLLKYLSRDRGVLILENDILKFSSSEEVPPSPITQQDREILQIRETLLQLDGQIEEISRRIQERTSKIQSSLSNNQKHQALSYLRSRKQLQEVLDRRIGSRETLGGVLLKIEQAKGDVEMMKAYELSTSTLKNLLSSAELQPSRIENTMTNLADTIADSEEIDQAIRIGGEAATKERENEIDDEELEEEMKTLEREMKREEEEKKEAEKKQKEEREKLEERKREEDRQRSEKEKEKEKEKERKEQEETTRRFREEEERERQKVGAEGQSGEREKELA